MGKYRRADSRATSVCKQSILRTIDDLNYRNNGRRRYQLDSIEKLPETTLRAILSMLTDIKVLRDDIKQLKGGQNKDMELEELAVAVEELIIKVDAMERALVRLESMLY